MKIAIISDTHDNIYAVREIINSLKNIDFDLLIHLGDIVSPRTADMFKDFKAVFVRGNNDGDLFSLKAVTEKNKQLFLDTFETNIGNKMLIALHGHKQGILYNLIQSQKYGYLLHGHTHKVEMYRKGKTLVFNPGGHYYMDRGGIILLDTETSSYDCIEISGKTRGEQNESNHI